MRPSPLRDQMTHLITMIRMNDGMADRLIAEHRCADHGKCACSTLNVPRPWPCPAYTAAVQATSWPQAGMRAVG